VAVEGRRARAEEAPAGADGGPIEVAHTISRSGSVDYRTTVPFQSWMVGGRLEFEGLGAGCCTVEMVELGVLADNILTDAPVPVQTIQSIRPIQTIQPEEYIAEPRTTGQAVARDYTFVRPLAEFEAAMEPGERFDHHTRYETVRPASEGLQRSVERIIDRGNDGSMTVYFRQGSKRLERGYMGNNRSLGNLIAAIRSIARSQDSRIARIVIAGFASPEGSLGFNERLAWDRAVALRNFICSNSPVRPEQVYIHNGSVDWLGLRDMIERGDMWDKWRILDVIDRAPSWGEQRLRTLQRLDGGEPYRIMLRDYFPYLRQAAFIKVFFEDTAYRTNFQHNPLTF
jgi:outer membrane protein OmpA-like peptidoglycan-associated protein